MGYLKSLLTDNDLVSDSNLLTLGKLDLTAQAADVAATTIMTAPSGGPTNVFKVSAVATVTQAATTSSTLPPVQVKYTDAENSTVQTVALTASNTGNALTTAANGTAIINAKQGTAIQVDTSGYASSGATPMQFALHARVEAL